jgi:polysaccharide deacetylase family protein (PEP-CTERM system associated)
MAPQPKGRVSNAVTVDVEDWHSLVYRDLVGADLPATEHTATGTRILLDLLAECGIRGTFFVTGRCAVAFRELIRDIAGAGHEVACHGWSHLPVWTLSREGFREELRRTVSAIEDATGERVLGYRAPLFSIRPAERWALEEVAAAGLLYDSSLSPLRFDAHGQPLAQGLQIINTDFAAPLVEFPMSTAAWFGKARNISGGRWFRTLPFGVISNGFRRLNEAGVAAQTYTHTYEVLPYRLVVPGPLRGVATRAKARLIEAAYAARRNQTMPRLRALLSQPENWAPISDLVAGFLASRRASPQ